ncbi:class A beta-lactamase [Sphingorhabdus sp.]|jgi:beta-lactamase class A|uniref:class A beta-lactamase n=1 Tax=Sphingorhabdus sp. TaxID=1902408 RepID=UPI0038FC76E3|nr:class A beta-lactamase [Sphingomonadaceae bacterium]MCF8497690.1 class A beta-lactamase [Sphingomonadaceae bacterium]
MEIDRRGLMAGAAALTIAGCAGPRQVLPSVSANAALAALEARVGGRLGACVLDTASGRMTGHRYGELFGMCSTFKLALAGAVLHLADKGRLNPSAELRYTEADMVPHAPVTGPNLAKGAMRIIELAEATQKTSDNVAANLLIRHMGGPAAVTALLRSWGDDVTRLDRYETEMNNVPPGEERDTTTPRAFAQTMARLLTTDRILSPASRALLIQWMVDTTTGGKRIRAGLPASWGSGDKTGSANSPNYNNKTNDVAIFWPPARMPVIVTAYYESDGKYLQTRDQDQAVLADVGRIAATQALEWHGGLD